MVNNDLGHRTLHRLSRTSICADDKSRRERRTAEYFKGLFIEISRDDVASDEMALTDKQKGLIRESWAKVDHKAHGMVFYEKLLTAHPEYLPLFKKFPNKDVRTMVQEEDPAFVTQSVATFSAIDKVISHLDNLDDITKMLKDLGKRHLKYGAREPEFLAVQPVVIDTLNAGLGGMSPDLQKAWETALKIICSVIVQGQS